MKKKKQKKMEIKKWTLKKDEIKIIKKLIK